MKQVTQGGASLGRPPSQVERMGSLSITSTNNSPRWHSLEQFEQILARYTFSFVEEDFQSNMYTTALS